MDLQRCYICGEKWPANAGRWIEGLTPGEPALGAPVGNVWLCRKTCIPALQEAVRTLKQNAAVKLLTKFVRKSRAVSMRRAGEG